MIRAFQFSAQAGCSASRTPPAYHAVELSAWLASARPRFAPMGPGSCRRHGDDRAHRAAKAVMADRAVQNATPPDVLTGPNH